MYIIMIIMYKHACLYHYHNDYDIVTIIVGLVLFCLVV